ncbi:MAG: hypothetical protein ACAI43_26400 [Phycisphaerae bacterium]|nr:hypothetical protein [Tepidisphaeraceae bacterium]
MSPKTPASTKLLTVVLVLQSVMLLGQWIGLPSAVTPAHAQIPDAGGQRNAMIDELRQVNAKLDKLATYLESGKLEVRVVEPKAR